MKTTRLISIVSLACFVLTIMSCNNDDDGPTLSAETDILTFTLEEAIEPPSITESTHSVSADVAADTDRSALAPEFTLSAGATSDPVSGTASDYETEFTITVTAEDGVTTQQWAVNILREEDPSVFCKRDLCDGNDNFLQQCIDTYNTCADLSQNDNNVTCARLALEVCEGN